MLCIFCDFISGKRKFQNKNGLPFKILNETKNTLSFLSMDFPEKEEGHILVTPKKHFKSLEDIPKKIQHELIEHVSLTSKILRKRHDGCNILLNQGKAAGQAVFHTHFHVVPRDKKDGIKIEVWKRKNLSVDQFNRLYDSIREDFVKKA